MRKLLKLIAALGAFALALTGCSGGGSGSDSGSSSKTLTVGFVAVGPEGGWRTANKTNIQNTFSKDNGINLKYAPSDNDDQASQITAMTSFIDEGVDAILLSATEATGWENVLNRAKEAEIPVFLLDRGIEPDNTSLYASRIAPDNVAISESAANWAVKQFPEGAKYVVLEGPAGLSVVNDRNKGWDSVMSTHPEFQKIASQSANWSQNDGKSVTETLLKANPGIQLIFAQNDEMGLGATQAVTEAGLTPGKDVKIITIDGTKAALESLSAGQLSFVAEYNPLFGDIALNAVKKAKAGEHVDALYTVDSVTFDSPEAAKAALPNRAY